MEKPITIKIEEFESNIIGSINNSGLPLFIIELIISNISKDIRSQYISQVQIDKEKYESSKSSKENDSDDDK